MINKVPSMKIDEETDIVTIKLNDNEIKESDSRGNCIIDFDKKGNVCRVEVFPFEITS